MQALQLRSHVNCMVRRSSGRDRRPFERALVKVLCPELLCPAVRLATPLAARLARVALPTADITISGFMIGGASRAIAAIFLAALRIRLFMRKKLIHHIKLIKIVRRG